MVRYGVGPTSPLRPPGQGLPGHRASAANAARDATFRKRWLGIGLDPGEPMAYRVLQMAHAWPEETELVQLEN